MAKVSVSCDYCGEVVERYPSQLLSSVYCSRECLKAYKRENHTEVFNCSNCGKEKRVRKGNYNYDGNNFCSIACKNIWQKEGLRGSSNPFFQKRHSDESRRMISASKIGLLTGAASPNFNSREVTCSYCGKITLKTQYLITRSRYLFCSVACNGKWKSENSIGENNPNWNPNLTGEERELQRKYPEYYVFLSEVLKRDNYTCDVCCWFGKWGVGLNVHHLNSYDWDIKNRTNVDNGITLCKGCHTDFHKAFGYGKNTKEQYLKFKEDILPQKAC